ncbi:MAG: 50S ribosomal protein L30 [Myxococcaceae bacterium]
MGYRVKLIKSIAGAPAGHVRTVEGLGLKRMGEERLLKDSPAMRGMVFTVRHLVHGEAVSQEPKPAVRRKPRHVRAREAARSRRADKGRK